MCAPRVEPRIPVLRYLDASCGIGLGRSRFEVLATYHQGMGKIVPPATLYAQSSDGTVGYQVFGEGLVDLVFVTQWGTNIDNYWDEPTAARYLDRLASFSRVILFDKRGTGVSDQVPMDDLPPMGSWMEDILTAWMQRNPNAP